MLAALKAGESGLGISWALVCYVAEIHEGTTAVTSQGPDQGSTFTIWLPAAEKV